MLEELKFKQEEERQLMKKKINRGRIKRKNAISKSKTKSFMEKVQKANDIKFTN